MTFQNERKLLSTQERALYANYMNGALHQLSEMQRKYTADLAAEQDPDEVLAIFERLCQGSRRFASEMHKVKMQIDWGHAPTPEWMNHYQDWFYQSPASGSTFWLERGIFARLCFRSAPKPQVLELCCGDGFNTKHFYAPYASRILALDFDMGAIRHATEFNRADNVTFALADIRAPFAQGGFDNVVWDAAIEHFTDAETHDILRNIRAALKPDGILSGYTLVENADGQKHLHQHEREFKDKQGLLDLLSPHFENVKVFETIAPQRHNLYFFASAGPLPFDARWPGVVQQLR